ncbi:MAG: hypothetical protein K6F33_02490 [Bacteroidales bacterium]|nr:hypothetical protein [Bacteroidales bacterium]
MKKHTLLIIAIMMLAFAEQSYGQFRDFENDTNGENNQGNNRNNQQGYRLIDHLRFGGDFGIGFSSDAFSVQFCPQVGYYFNEYITAGIIGTYDYYRYNSGYQNALSSSVYGGGIYADCIPLRFLVVHAEAQAICYDNYWANFNEPEKQVDVPIMIGGGYHRQITDRASVNFMLLWNLNATKGLENNTSFSNPIVRINLIF